MAEAFGWFGYSILEEMDMEEAIERLNERIDRLQSRVKNLENVVSIMKQLLTDHIEWDLDEHKKVKEVLTEMMQYAVQSR